ncbi:MAG TPA: tetratricopeptide repeat protein [Candidatus Binataceae bacterium]|nr:tetratricopeptide repeat protein [Candidatus Binataceae bacterium]
MASCNQGAIDANNRLVQQNQAIIEQNQKEIAELQAQQQSYSTTPPPPGGCDKQVMADASRRAGDRVAAGDLRKALGYYQDALAACPGNPNALLNVANTEDALGNRDQAIVYYQQAAASTDPAGADAARQARATLKRLGASN